MAIASIPLTSPSVVPMAIHSDSVITQVLGDFHYQFSSISGRDADRVIDLGKFALIEAYIQYGTDDLG